MKPALPVIGLLAVIMIPTVWYLSVRRIEKIPSEVVSKEEHRTELIRHRPLPDIQPRLQWFSLVGWSMAGPNTYRLLPPPKPKPRKVKVVTENLGGKDVDDAYTASQLAASDLIENVGPDYRPYTRYISLYPFANDPKKLVQIAKIVSFAVNSLSYRGVLYAPRVVPGSKGTLLRIDIRDYKWDPKVWEELCRKDPYFTARLIKTRTERKFIEKEVDYKDWHDWPGGVDPYFHKYYPPGRYYYIRTKIVRVPVDVVVAQEEVLVPAPWLDAGSTPALQQLTGSFMPIVRGDWFLATALKPPFYEKFLGLEKNEKDFQKNNVVADPDLAARFEKDAQGTVVFSGVTVNNRRLTRVPTILGYYWYSTDAKKSIDKQNYMQILLDRNRDNYDASEQIYSLPNGLQAYALFNNKGELQQVVPPDIASNHMAVGNDKQIYNGISCIVCHSTGILSFRSSFQDLVGPREDLKKRIDLRSPDYEKLYRIYQLYGADLSVYFEADQRFYNQAVEQCTSGLTSVQVASLVAEFYNGYAEYAVTPEVAARDLGIRVDDLAVYLKGSKRPEILSLIQDPPVPVRREQWERAFADAAILVHNHTRLGGKK